MVICVTAIILHLCLLHGPWCKIFFKSLQIFFIDYGNTEMVDFKDIVVIPASLQREPGFAMETCLNGVTSTG